MNWNFIKNQENLVYFLILFMVNKKNIKERKEERKENQN